MPVFDPNLLAEWTGGAWQGPPAGRIAGFGIDSRSLLPGQMFVAIRTVSRDGHAFLGSARAKGASAALVARFEPDLPLAQLVVDDTVRALQDLGRAHRMRFSGPVIGITGSSGKTSTRELLALALGADDKVHATSGNLNNTLGVPLTLLGIDAGVHDYAVVEAGISEPGEMDQLAGMIQPDVVLITTIGPAHLESLKTLDNVAREKSRLIGTLRPNGRVFIPRIGLHWETLLTAPTTVVAPVSSDLADTDHGWSATVRFRSRSSGVGAAIEVCLEGGQNVSILLHSTSRGMASNAVLALAVANHLGVDPDSAATRMSAWRPVTLRGEVKERSGQLVYLDCYNANPASMLDAVHAFIDRVDDSVPRLYVVGSMEELGGDSDAWHRKVGREWPVGPIDRFALVGKQGPALRDGLIESGHDESLIEVGTDAGLFRDRVEAWGGAIFIKGSRCHHLEQLLDSVRTGVCPEEAKC